jgi:hypothetical protein
MAYFDKWVLIAVIGSLLAIWAAVAVFENLFLSDAVCSACGRNLNQTSTCRDHESVCCDCYGHTYTERHTL